MDKVRAKVVGCLQTKLKPSSAKKYEASIYNMCCRLNGGKASLTTYQRMAYDKVGQLIQAKDTESRNAILDDIENDVEGWGSSAYEPQFTRYEKAMNSSIEKPKPVKLPYKCKVKECDSYMFYIWSAQVRGCDESSSNYRQCFKCGKISKE